MEQQSPLQKSGMLSFLYRKRTVNIFHKVRKPLSKKPELAWNAFCIYAKRPSPRIHENKISVKLLETFDGVVPKNNFHEISNQQERNLQQ